MVAAEPLLERKITIPKVTIDNAITLLEHVLQLKISPEKKRILKYDYQTPVLICSAAGSGKTTLIMLSCLTKLIMGELNAGSMLGITFSHRARIDMQSKFRAFSQRFRENGFPIAQAPHFTTFHALFLHLLKRLQPVQVLPSYTMIENVLYRAIKKPSAYQSEPNIIKKAFQLRNQLINGQYSYDGCTLQGYPSDIDGLKTVSNDLGHNFEDSFYINYFSIIRTYQQYKRKHNLVDFSDMEVLVYRALKSPKKRHAIRQAMLPYRICFIDEFQDINNLQWSIMKQILSKTALHHLVVVGDDDQSIYGFRGSNPNIILNFAHKIPRTKVFHLSINYRTGGRILSSVKPLIENNQYRLAKNIQSNQPKVGNVIEYKSKTPKHNSGYVILNQLERQIRNPHINNRQIAVLCRYNLDKMFAIDWLANHKVYIVTNKGDILQNNRNYRVYYDLMSGLWEDRFSLINKHAGQIGFRYYRIHIQMVLRYFHLQYVKKLSKYLRLASKFDTQFKSQIKHSSKHGKFIIINDDHLASAYQSIHAKGVPSSSMTKRAYSSAHFLVKNYYKFMDNKKFINPVWHQSIEDYLSERTQDSPSLKAFFKAEGHKRQILSHPREHQMSTLNVMTLHQSKGLQFQYVYLYNLHDQDVVPSLVEEDKVFPPNTTPQQFVSKLSELRTNTLDSFGPDSSDLSELAEDINDTASIIMRLIKIRKLHNRPILNRNKYHQLYSRIITKIGIHLADNSFPKVKVAPSFATKAQSLFNELYPTVMQASTLVEEERRLIYVGMTRAKLGVFINIDPNANPLLFELNVDKENILNLTKQGTLKDQKQLQSSLGIKYQQLSLIKRNLNRLD